MLIENDLMCAHKIKTINFT